MKIITETTINKSANDVWEIMGKQFAQIHHWASFFKDSQPVGDAKFKKIDFSAGDTIVEGGQNTHTLDVFDNEKHLLSYTVTAGAPPFANKAEAEWALEIINENSCKASITVNMDLKDMVPTEKATEVKGWLN